MEHYVLVLAILNTGCFHASYVRKYQKSSDYNFEVMSCMTKNDINANSKAPEVDVFATFRVLMHVEIDMF